MNKLTIKNALTKVGVTDKEKQDVFFAAFGSRSLADISEQEVKAALEKIGVTDDQAQTDFFAAVREPEILDQEIDLDELESVAGGDCDLKDQEADQNCCVKDHTRTHHRDGCAATTGYKRLPTCSGGPKITTGHCLNNDYCDSWAVVYTDIYEREPAGGM